MTDRIIERIENFTDTAGYADVSVYENNGLITLELIDGYGHEWFSRDYKGKNLKETFSEMSYDLWTYDAASEAEMIIQSNVSGKPDFWELYTIASDINKTAENLAVWLDEYRKERH